MGITEPNTKIFFVYLTLTKSMRRIFLLLSRIRTFFINVCRRFNIWYDKIIVKIMYVSLNEVWINIKGNNIE